MTPNDRAAMDDARPTRAEAILKAGQDWLFHDDQNRFVREVLKALSRPESPVARSVAGEAVAWQMRYVDESKTGPWRECSENTFHDIKPTGWEVRALGVIEAVPQPSSQAVDAQRDTLSKEWALGVLGFSVDVMERDSTGEIGLSRYNAERVACVIAGAKAALAPQPTERAQSTESEVESAIR